MGSPSLSCGRSVVPERVCTDHGSGADSIQTWARGVTDARYRIFRSDRCCRVGEHPLPPPRRFDNLEDAGSSDPAGEGSPCRTCVVPSPRRYDRGRGLLPLASNSKNTGPGSGVMLCAPNTTISQRRGRAAPMPFPSARGRQSGSRSPIEDPARDPDGTASLKILSREPRIKGGFRPRERPAPPPLAVLSPRTPRAPSARSPR